MYCQRLIGTLAVSAIFGLALVPAAVPAQLHQAGADHRAVRAGRNVGHPGASHRAQVARRNRPAGSGREQDRAGGNIGADLVAKADKDGHTLLLIDISTLAISPNLFANMTQPDPDLRRRSA